MFKKLLTFVVLLSLGAALFAGCGGSDGGEDIINKVTLTINITGQGTVNRIPEGTSISSGLYSYDKNQEVILEAEPAAGYEFEQWVGIDSESETVTIVMDDNRQVGVVFSETSDEDQEQVVTPVITPEGGTYSSKQDIVIECATSGAKIYYTTDGSTPTQESTEYTGSFEISSDTVLKAKAYKDGMESSEVATEEYIIDIPEPAGDEILFIRNNAVYNMEIVNGEVEDTVKIKDLSINNSYSDEWGGPTWTPEKEKIAFIDEDSGGDLEVFFMNEDGTDVEQVTNNNSDELFVDWAPNGEKIVFESDRDKWEIYIRSIDGSVIRRLTDNNANDWYPDWSPGGHRIIFSSDRDGDFDIYSCDLYGEDTINLTDSNSQDKYPAWSSDGEKIAFASDRGDGHFDIYVMDKNGENVQQITDTGGDAYSPTWSQDDEKIIFASDIDGDFDIYMVDSDGYNRVQLTDNSTFDGFPFWKHTE